MSSSCHHHTAQPTLEKRGNLSRVMYSNLQLGRVLLENGTRHGGHKQYQLLISLATFHPGKSVSISSYELTFEAKIF